MPRDLFAPDTASPVSRSRRSSLLIVSILAHAVLVVVLLVVSVLIPDVLPRPHAAGLAWDPTVSMVTINDIPLPAPPRARAPVPTEPTPDAVPLYAPEQITPERTPTLAPPPLPGGLDGGTFGSDLTPLAPAPAVPAAAPPPREPVRVFAGVDPPRKLLDVAPTYPVTARTAGIQGLVIIEATIDASGNVVDTKVLRSVPMLDAAAADAVRQWKYTPARLNGEPIPVLITVTVNFVLGPR